MNDANRADRLLELLDNVSADQQRFFAILCNKIDILDRKIDMLSELNLKLNNARVDQLEPGYYLEPWNQREFPVLRPPRDCSISEACVEVKHNLEKHVANVYEVQPEIQLGKSAAELAEQTKDPAEPEEPTESSSDFFRRVMGPQ